MALTLALDTNRYVDLVRNDATARAVVERAERVYLPFIVLGELRAGFLAGARAAANDSTLAEFLRSPHVDVLWAEEATTREFARLMVQLKQNGTPMPTNDVWIAALCLQHDVPLFTRDRHFDAIPRLARL